MTTKRKVRADFDKNQSITVNVSGCTEEEKKMVQQAFFDVGIEWSFGGPEYRSLDKDFYTNVNSDGEFEDRLMWASLICISDPPETITPKQFFAMVYEDEPQGHPHAELMMAYAEDAKTHAEPWKLWQVGSNDFPWNDLTNHPAWCVLNLYRRKPKTHLVHGVEVPDLRIEPINGDVYYHPSPSNPNMYEAEEFDSTIISDIHKLENNLCYEHTEAGKQAAILHAKAMLGIA